MVPNRTLFEFPSPTASLKLSALRILISTASFLSVSSLSAYPTPVDFDGKLLRWNISLSNPNVTWVIKDEVTGNSYYRSLVEDSAQLWSDIPSSLLDLVEFDPSTQGALDADQRSQADISIYLQQSIDGGSYSAGYSIFDEFSKSGPTHCSIYILTDLDDYAVAKTILHELGHCLGLGHSLIPEAIMSYSLDQNRFGLDTDDDAAISRLYPLGGSAPQLPIGCAVGSWLNTNKLSGRKTKQHANPFLPFPSFLAWIMFLPLSVVALKLSKTRLAHTPKKATEQKQLSKKTQPTAI